MNSADRKEFDGELAVLFGGFPQFLTPPRIEAYWRGLAKMPLVTFRRCVHHALGESGTDKLPTVNTIWQISRRMRTQLPTQQQAQQASLYDAFACLGQRWLFAFLLRKEGASADSIPKMVEMKNRIVEQFRCSGDACGGPATADWLAIANGAFEKLWQEMPEAEIEQTCQLHSRELTCA